MKRKLLFVLITLLFSLQETSLFIGNATSLSDYVENVSLNEFNEDNYNIVFNITQKWDNYYNADITINNISDSDIENWEISFKSPN